MALSLESSISARPETIVRRALGNGLGSSASLSSMSRGAYLGRMGSALTALGLAIGCASSPARSGESDGGQDATAQEPGGGCVPGRKVWCACSNGITGSQECAPSGREYQACVCGDGGSSDARSGSRDAKPRDVTSADVHVGSGDASPGADSGDASAAVAFCRGCALAPSVLSVFDAGARPLVGIYYFDGWANESGPSDGGTGNYHLEPPDSYLLSPPWNEREPLTGWYDADAGVIVQDSLWASAAGFDFWLFDWYATAFAGTYDKQLNVSQENFAASSQKSGMSFAIDYVANDYPIPAADWDTYCQTWIDTIFANDAYLKVDGKPVMFILNPANLDSTFADAGSSGSYAVSRLRTLATTATADAGPPFPGVYVVAIAASPSTVAHFHAEGYDAFTEYNYPCQAPSATDSQKNDAGQYIAPAENPFFDLSTTGEGVWASFADYQVEYDASFAPGYIPSVTLGWDARPWRSSTCFYDRDPLSVADFVLQAELWTVQHATQNLPGSSRPLMVLEAWNELGEGSYVVPTVGDQAAYLESVATVIPP
jgi:Glycosyltransferase WbsX